jgi:hypothetical protein
MRKEGNAEIAAYQPLPQDQGHKRPSVVGTPDSALQPAKVLFDKIALDPSQLKSPAD